MSELCFGLLDSKKSVEAELVSDILYMDNYIKSFASWERWSL